jgi:hypothetical protein
MQRDRRAKFVELAEARVARAIKTIRLIGNLSSRNNYEYSDLDVNKIITALDNEVKMLRVKFQAGGSRKGVEFKL